MELVINTIIMLIWINICAWLFRIGVASLYISKSTDSSRPCENRFVIVIPVLNETKRIRSAIEMCERVVTNQIDIVFATSSKEKKTDNELNTIEIISAYQKVYPWIKSYQYTGQGHMAHQLNYAIKCYCDEFSVDANTIFAVYNIDSVIEYRILAWVAEQYMFGTKQKVVFQQYGNYCKNWNDCVDLPWYQRAILRSNMLWQTRWSIGFEMSHAIIGRAIRKKNIWFMNYCIGHGLFFDFDTYNAIGGFEEESLNEDAIFGLQACIKNIPIIPVPSLEAADSPDCMGALFWQKVTWIYGPGQAFLYKKLLQDRGEKSVIRLTCLCIQLFEHAVRWVLLPTVIAIAIPLSFSVSFYHGVILLLSIGFYLEGINCLCKMIGDKQVSLSGTDILLTTAGCIPQFLLHGLSGWIGLLQLLGKTINGTKINKRKTEMRDDHVSAT